MPAASMVIAEAAGVYGGASVALGYLGLDNQFVAYEKDESPITISSGQAHGVYATGRGEVILRVTGAGPSTNIAYLVTPVTEKHV